FCTVSGRKAPFQPSGSERSANRYSVLRHVAPESLPENLVSLVMVSAAPSSALNSAFPGAPGTTTSTVTGRPGPAASTGVTVTLCGPGAAVPASTKNAPSGAAGSAFTVVLAPPSSCHAYESAPRPPSQPPTPVPTGFAARRALAGSGTTGGSASVAVASCLP